MAATALTRRTLFPDLLRKLRSIPGGPATAFRSLTAYPLPELENNSDSDSDDGGFFNPGAFHFLPRMRKQVWKNAPKAGGGRGSFHMWEDEAGLHVRVDMPGLSKEHVKVWLERGGLYIRGEGPKGVGDCEGGDVADGRKYIAKIRLPDKACKLSEIHAAVKNGVLKVMVPAAEEERRHVQPVKVT